MATIFKSRIITALSDQAGKYKETTPVPDTMQLVDGQRTDVDEATQNARSCPLFAFGGYLSPLLDFGAGLSVTVDHVLNRVPEGAFAVLLMGGNATLWVSSLSDKNIVVTNSTATACQARFWIF